MKWIGIVFCVLVANQAWAEELTATDIVQKSDTLLRGLESHARLSMHIVRPEWNRSLSMDAWSQGRSNSFIRILKPRKERGVTFLKKGREAWQYVPAIDRTIKVPPSMMLQSWLGSDFTNDDLVRADSIVVDYTHKILNNENERWIIEAIPKKDAPVVWGKLLFTIRQSSFISEQVDYFDEDGEKIKTFKSANIKTIEGRDLPTEMTIYDLTRDGYRTTLKYESLTFEPDLKPDTFSLKNLKRSR